MSLSGVRGGVDDPSWICWKSWRVAMRSADSSGVTTRSVKVVRYIVSKAASDMLGCLCWLNDGCCSVVCC